MKAKKGYKKQRGWDSLIIGKWLKYYFEKRTCRRRPWRMKVEDNDG